MQRSIEHQARRRIRRPLVIAAARLCVAALSQPNLAYAGVAVSTAVADSMAAPDTAGYRWLGRPAVTLKVCRGDRGRNAGLLPARPNWMRTMTLEQTASLRADVIKLNPLIAYNPPWRG
jgi:hypothetical protein